jgi:hypothetical protein
VPWLGRLRRVMVKLRRVQLLCGRPAANRPQSPRMSSTDDRTSVSTQQAALDYLRDIEADLRHWYRAAETKAQLILTVDGVFLTFLTTSVLTKRDDVARTTAAFGIETWAFLAGMSSCLTLSIMGAVACLASRGLGRRHRRNLLHQHHVKLDEADTYVPELTAFFFYLAALQPDQLSERMLTVDMDFVLRAHATDIVPFSQFIVAKHRWVNFAFMLTGTTLGLFLATGISYVLRVHFSP